MRRFNPGRPCCRVCPEDCYIPAYRVPPSRRYDTGTPGAIDRWDRYPVYSGAFSNRLDAIYNTCYQPSSSGDISYYDASYEYVQSHAISSPSAFGPPPLYNKPIRTYRLSFAGDTRPLQIGENSIFTCQQAYGTTGQVYELTLDSETGSDCGEKTFTYLAKYTTQYMPLSGCSSTFTNIPYLAKLEINIDESEYARGIIPSGGTFYRLAGSFNGTSLGPTSTGVTPMDLNFYNNTVSTPNKPSKLWMTVVASGLPYTAYYECGRDNSSGVVQSHYYRGIPAQFCFVETIGFFTYTRSDAGYYRQPQKYLCGDDTDNTKLRDSSTDPFIQYDRPKGYWRLVDSWKGTIDNVIESNVRNFGKVVGDNDFSWTNICPNLYPYDDIATIGSSIGGTPQGGANDCSYNYIFDYRPPKDTATPGLTATVVVAGLTNEAAIFNGSHTLPLGSSPLPKDCGRGYSFSIEKREFLCVRAASFPSPQVDLTMKLNLSVGIGTEGDYTVTMGVGIGPHNLPLPANSGCEFLRETFGESISRDPCNLTMTFPYVSYNLQELLAAHPEDINNRYLQRPYLGATTGFGAGGGVTTSYNNWHVMSQSNGEQQVFGCGHKLFEYVAATMTFPWTYTTELIARNAGGCRCRNASMNNDGTYECTRCDCWVSIDNPDYAFADLTGIG